MTNHRPVRPTILKEYIDVKLDSYEYIVISIQYFYTLQLIRLYVSRFYNLKLTIIGLTLIALVGGLRGSSVVEIFKVIGPKCLKVLEFIKVIFTKNSLGITSERRDGKRMYNCLILSHTQD